MIFSTAAVLLCCSKRQNVSETTQQDTILTHDSTVEGLTPYSPDDDQVPTVDSTAYNLDSIQKSK